MIRPLVRSRRTHRPASPTTPRRPSRSLTGRVLEFLEHRVVLTATAPGTITLITPPTGFVLSPAAGDSIQGTGSSQTALAGQPTKFTALASFTVPGSVLDAGPFQANVTWSDGTSNDQATPESLGPGGPEIDVVGPIYGTIGADPNAQYTLRFDDLHTFAQPGTYSFTVTFLTGYAGTPAATATGTVTVTAQSSQGGAIVGHGYNLNATAGVSTLYYEAGTFQIPAADAGHNFTATIDWGDGTPATWGGLSPGGGEDTFSGQHIYAAAGTYTYTVTLYEDGVAAGSAQGTYNVAAAVNTGVAQGQALDKTATAGAAATFDPLATFTMPASMYEAVPSSITVAWGDGSSPSYATSAVWSLEGTQATESVGADHTFAAPGTYTYTVTYANMMTGTILGTATGTVTVAAADPNLIGPIDPIETLHPIAVIDTIFIGPPTEFSLFGMVPGMLTFTPYVPPANLFLTGRPIATTPAPVVTAPTPVTTSAPTASPFAAWLADFDVIFAELSAGLYAVPPQSPFTASPAVADTGSTLMVNPFQVNANYWDAGLALLAT